MIARFILTSSAALLLSACAANNSQPVDMAANCAASDWAAIGRADGANGVLTSQSKAAACGGAITAYNFGHAEGLGAYCTMERGYSEAMSARPYSGACPPHLAPAFEKGYTQGASERLVSRSNAPQWNQRIGVGVGIDSDGDTSLGIHLGTVLGL